MEAKLICRWASGPTEQSETVNSTPNRSVVDWPNRPAGVPLIVLRDDQHQKLRAKLKEVEDLITSFRDGADTPSIAYEQLQGMAMTAYLKTGNLADLEKQWDETKNLLGILGVIADDDNSKEMAQITRDMMRLTKAVHFIRVPNKNITFVTTKEFTEQETELAIASHNIWQSDGEDLPK